MMEEMNLSDRQLARLCWRDFMDCPDRIFGRKVTKTVAYMIKRCPTGGRYLFPVYGQEDHHYAGNKPVVYYRGGMAFRSDVENAAKVAEYAYKAEITPVKPVENFSKKTVAFLNRFCYNKTIESEHLQTKRAEQTN